MLLRQNTLHLCFAKIDPAFRHDLVNGLSTRPRAIPARWLYDRSAPSSLRRSLGCRSITRPGLSARYCPSRQAKSRTLAGPGGAVVEFGSGSSAKTPILLSAVSPSAHVLIDISIDFLWESVERLSETFPDLTIYPVEGDFTDAVRLPTAVKSMPQLGFCPGSTIGNLVVPAAVDLLRKMAATLGAGSMLLIGIDPIKDVDVLLPAYDDARGVTAAFNLNLLHRINRELEGSVPVNAFRHLVRWNDAEARIEMHLEAARDVRFAVVGQHFSMAKGETIDTENSFKYGLREASVLLRAGGWTPISDWTDDKGLFSVVLAKEGGPQRHPNLFTSQRRSDGRLVVAYGRSATGRTRSMHRRT